MITDVAENIEFRNAIVSNIELKNGTQTQIVTIFNNSEFNFEEMKIGLDYALGRIQKNYVSIKSVQTNFNKIIDAKLHTVAKFRKQEFENKETQPV